MSILTIAWSMCGTACAMLALMQVFLWLKNRTDLTLLWAVIMAASASANAFIELSMMHVTDPHAYGDYLVWQNAVIFMLLVSMIWFIHQHFRTGRRWLAVVITALWAGGMLVNFSSPYSVTFLEVSRLSHPVTYWGESFTFPVGTTHPWKIVTDIASLLIAVYILDASITLWRKGNRSRAWMLGGSMLLFIVVAGIHTPLVDEGLVATPYMVSFAFLGIVFAMSHGIVSEAVRSLHYARELAAGERRWQDLMENVQLAILGIDAQGRVDYANPFLKKLYGDWEEGMLGRPISALVPLEQRNELHLRLQQAAEHMPRAHSRWGFVCSSGDVREMEWSTVKLVDVNGRFTGLLSIGNDLTDRLRAERELSRTRLQMERWGRANLLGELTSALAHELNQPLTAILANAQAARRLMRLPAHDQEEIKEILDDIIRDDKRAGKVIHGLRAMLRGSAERDELFNLNRAVHEVLELLEGDIKAHPVRLHLDLHETDILVRAGKVEIQQVLLNLLVNALRALRDTPAGQCEIRVRTRLQRGRVLIDVDDNGPGIDPDDLPRIFEPFITSNTEGLGMGLAICRRIVENWGGCIKAVNKEKGGARFSFNLPNAVSNGESGDEREPS